MIDKVIYEQLFRGPQGIRVELNWDAVRSGEWPVEAEVIETVAELHGYFPWYLAEDGREVAYFENGAQPVPVPEVRALEGRLNEARRAKILSMRRSYEVMAAVQLMIPAYSLGSNRCLILDACHRLAALAAIGAPFKGLLLTLHGPIDVAVLPDLRHWASS